MHISRHLSGWLVSTRCKSVNTGYGLMIDRSESIVLCNDQVRTSDPIYDNSWRLSNKDFFTKAKAFLDSHDLPVMLVDKILRLIIVMNHQNRSSQIAELCELVRLCGCAS